MELFSFFPTVLYGLCIICVYFMSKCFVLYLQYFENVFVCVLFFLHLSVCYVFL
jgi:hypothetical protein